MTRLPPHPASPPRIVEWPERSYAFIAHRLPLADVGPAVADGFARVEDWLRRRGLAPAGVPFLRYRRIDMAGTLDIETGIPVEGAGVAEAPIGFDRLPAGRYAGLLWSGPYDSLVAGNAELIAWGGRERIAWDMTPSPEGDRFGARLEPFLVGPAQEPDPANWLTEIAIRIAEDETGHSDERLLPVPPSEHSA
ncbi:MAG: GyrI-like domain-containing protein [Tabrizicola flagellatus]|uniref:GyrI-like domain-containing protein n=1 Tax=Tabrizicola flagellatus TaxID=2593021 RepID=UPI0039192C72